MRSILLFFAISTTLFCGLVHNPYQNTFNIDCEGDFAMVTVKTTPTALIKVLRVNGEIEANQSLIKLNEFKEVLESYFKERIQLKINNKLVTLELETYNFKGHEALLVFKIENNTQPVTMISGKINAFEDAYNRFQNVVNISAKRNQYQIKLNRANTVFKRKL